MTFERNKKVVFLNGTAHESIEKIELDHGGEIKYFLDPFLIIPNRLATPLHIAVCKEQKLDLILKLIRHCKKWVYTKDSQGNLPLHLAVVPAVCNTKCDPRVVKALINSWTLRQKNHKGWTAIHKAVHHNASIEVLQLLLRKKTVVNIKNKDGNTALHLAARPGYDPKKLQVLLDAGANGLLTNLFKRTPLCKAAASGCCGDIIRVLMQCRESINITDIHHNSPLRLAMYYCEPDLILALLDAGADLNCVGSKKMSPLHVVAMRKDLHHLFPAILRNNPKLDLRDENSNTPLHTALLYGVEKDSLQILIRAGSDIDLLGELKRTALHLAIVGECSRDVINELLAYRLDWLHLKESLTGNTPLHLVRKEPRNVERLIAAGADPWKENNLFENALLYALRNKCNCLVVKELLKHMERNPLIADVKKGNYVSEAVLCNSKPSVVRALVMAGFNVYKDFLCGDIPLHFASKRDSAIVRELLRGHPETMNVRDIYGDPPLKFSDNKGYNLAKASIHWTALQSGQIAKSALDMCKRLEFGKLLYSYLDQCLKSVQEMKEMVVSSIDTLYDLVLEEYQTRNSFKRPWTREQELRYKWAYKALDYCNSDNVYWDDIRKMQNIIAASQVFDVKLYTNNTPFGERVTLMDDVCPSVYQYFSIPDMRSVAMAFLPDLEYRLNRLSASSSREEKHSPYTFETSIQIFDIS